MGNKFHTMITCIYKEEDFVGRIHEERLLQSEIVKLLNRLGYKYAVFPNELIKKDTKTRMVNLFNNMKNHNQEMLGEDERGRELGFGCYSPVLDSQQPEEQACQGEGEMHKTCCESNERCNPLAQITRNPSADFNSKEDGDGKE